VAELSRPLSRGSSPASFADRHVGPDAAAIDRMLAALGFESLDALCDAAVPASIRGDGGLDLPAPLSEAEVLASLRALADRNEVFTSLIGLGYHGTITPPVIRRNVLESPAWYTAYTPYQPEISQGRLEALINFQTAVADLTGMDIANASMLDEPTAAAEAMALLHRVNGRAGDTFLVDADCHPQTIAVVRMRASPTSPTPPPATTPACSARWSSTRARAAVCATTGA
jgi:glycine dehydrogenase